MVLALSLVLGICSFPTAYADDFDKEYLTEMNFLKVLKLVEEDYDSTLVITKAEIAQMILATLYSEVDFSGMINKGQVFSDVPYEHPKYAVVTAAKDLGIVNGDGTSCFYPDKQINLAEGIAMLVNALGYTLHAKELGGYPSGYYQIAREIGMLKNVSLGLSDTVNGGDAVRLLYNSLFASVVETVSYGSDGVELRINSNLNILGERFSIYEYIATVTDDGITSIEGDSINDPERAVIRVNKTGDTIKAYTEGCDLKAYLGMRVKVFVRNNEEEGRYEFVYAAPYGNDDTVTLNVKDIVTVNDSYVEYDEDLNTSKTEKIKLSAEKPVVIFNGIRIVNKTLTSLIPKDGFVRFIENNGDGNYDIAIIYSFNYLAGNFDSYARNIVVDEIITMEDEEGISCLLNPSASIDLNEDEYIYTFIMNEKYKKLSDLSKGVIVSVAEAPEKIDGKTYYLLAVSDKSYDGQVAAIGGENEVYVNDTDFYQLSTSITSVKSSFINTLKSGLNITVYEDITGKAAYIKSEHDSSKNYAYMVKAVKKSQGDDFVLVKFFGKDGKMQTLPLSDKATIDGVNTAGMTPDEKIARLEARVSHTPVANAAATGRPVIITVSNEKITKIDTDNPNDNLSTGNISKTYVKQSLIQYYEDDAESYDTLKAGFRSPRAAAVRGTSKTVGGKFFITSSTVILSVPEIDTFGLRNLTAYTPYGYDTLYLNSSYAANADMIKLYEMENIDSNYKVLALGNISSTYSFDLQGYDIDPDTGVAGLVVVRGKTNSYRSVPTGTPMSVFVKLAQSYDEESEKMVTKVYYNEKGDLKSATIDLDECHYPYKALIQGAAAGDTPHNAEVKALKAGDIIRVITSGEKITHIERVLRTKDYKDAYGFVQYSRPATVSYAASVSGTRSTFPFDMPVPDEDDNYTPESNNTLSNSFVWDIKGQTMTLLSPMKRVGQVKDIDPENPASYSSLYYKLGTNSITVIDIPEDGGEPEIREGTVNDITTLKEADYDTGKASFIIMKIVSSEPEQIIVINGADNL